MHWDKAKEARERVLAYIVLCYLAVDLSELFDRKLILKLTYANCFITTQQ